MSAASSLATSSGSDDFRIDSSTATFSPSSSAAIWAERAWHRYWGWDTKEVWTFIIWVLYAGYLHAMATRGWTGKRAAWLGLIGFAAVIFNFTVVNLFFKGLHVYSGL